MSDTPCPDAPPPNMELSEHSLPDAVVFDFDGLMLDTEWTGYASANEVFRAHGAELSLDLWQSFVGTTDHPHWADVLEEQLGRGIDRERWERWRRDDHITRARALELLPGVQELIDALYDAGVPLGVASSSRGTWVPEHLEHRDLHHRFEVILTGSHARSKPHPELYQLACRRLGADPARAVAVEDSTFGITAAKAAGMWAVAVPGHLTSHHDYSAADLVVQSCEALDPWRLGRLVGGSDGTGRRRPSNWG